MLRSHLRGTFTHASCVIRHSTAHNTLFQPMLYRKHHQPTLIHTTYIPTPLHPTFNYTPNTPLIPITHHTVPPLPIYILTHPAHTIPTRPAVTFAQLPPLPTILTQTLPNPPCPISTQFNLTPTHLHLYSRSYHSTTLYPIQTLPTITYIQPPPPPTVLTPLKPSHTPTHPTPFHPTHSYIYPPTSLPTSQHYTLPYPIPTLPTLIYTLPLPLPTILIPPKSSCTLPTQFHPTLSYLYPPPSLPTSIP